MKVVLSLVVLLVSAQTRAVDIACFTERPLVTSFGNVTAMVFEGVEIPEDADDLGDLESSLPDQNALTPFSPAGGNYSASFSNECDNEYTVSFPARAFRALVEGSNDEIRGTIRYKGADDVSSSAQLRCRPL